MYKLYKLFSTRYFLISSTWSRITRDKVVITKTSLDIIWDIPILVIKEIASNFAPNLRAINERSENWKLQWIMQFGHVGWLADIHEKSLISWLNVGQTFDSFPSENVKSRRFSSILKTWNNTRLFFVLISYLNRLLIQYLVVIHCYLHIGRKGIKISLGWEDRSDDYLTINRCCPNLIEGGGRKKFGFNAIFASMRCDRKRVSIISLLGIYIHSRNGMNNKKKGGKGGTQRSMTRRTWKQTEHD